MGGPYVYYIRAKQLLAHALAYDESPKIAKKLSEELTDDTLDAYIISKKIELPEKNFYYSAGRAIQVVLQEAYEDGCDAFNASVVGTDMFEDFIGLK